MSKKHKAYIGFILAELINKGAIYISSLLLAYYLVEAQFTDHNVYISSVLFFQAIFAALFVTNFQIFNRIGGLLNFLIFVKTLILTMLAIMIVFIFLFQGYVGLEENITYINGILFGACSIAVAERLYLESNSNYIKKYTFLTFIKVAPIILIINSGLWESRKYLDTLFLFCFLMALLLTTRARLDIKSLANIENYTKNKLALKNICTSVPNRLWSWLHTGGFLVIFYDINQEYLQNKLTIICLLISIFLGINIGITKLFAKNISSPLNGRTENERKTVMHLVIIAMIIGFLAVFGVTKLLLVKYDIDLYEFCFVWLISLLICIYNIEYIVLIRNQRLVISITSNLIAFVLLVSLLLGVFAYAKIDLISVLATLLLVNFIRLMVVLKCRKS